MNEIDQLAELLRRPPKGAKVNSIQAATAFKQLHTRATKYLNSKRHTKTQTTSLISELQEYQ